MRPARRLNVTEGLRFPAELLPHDAARRLLETLGVTIVTGDQALIVRAQEALSRSRDQAEPETATAAEHAVRDALSKPGRAHDELADQAKAWLHESETDRQLGALAAELGLEE